jgi:phage repressor protein C with HTH and peptisase S24 domain
MAFDFNMNILNHSSERSATTVHQLSAIVTTVVEYKDRLADAMKAAGVSTTRLARELDISYQAVKKVLLGGSAAFNTENNAAAARYLGVNSDWLATGKGERAAPTVAAAPNTIYETKPPFPGLPVVGTAKLGDDGNFCELEYPVGHGDGRIAWPSRDPNGYALRCNGDSMKPRIRHGEYVVVEPNHPVTPGDEVLVKSKDGRVMVKQLAYMRDGMVYLDSVNETHPRLSIPEDQLDAFHYVAGIARSAMWRDE